MCFDSVLRQFVRCATTQAGLLVLPKTQCEVKFIVETVARMQSTQGLPQPIYMLRLNSKDSMHKHPYARSVHAYATITDDNSCYTSNISVISCSQLVM